MYANTNLRELTLCFIFTSASNFVLLNEIIDDENGDDDDDVDDDDDDDIGDDDKDDDDKDDDDDIDFYNNYCDHDQNDEGEYSGDEIMVEDIVLAFHFAEIQNCGDRC